MFNILIKVSLFNDNGEENLDQAFVSDLKQHLLENYDLL
jgi:hypothetical protein